MTKIFDSLLVRMVAIYGKDHMEVKNFQALIDEHMPFTFLLALVRFHEADKQTKNEG